MFELCDPGSRTGPEFRFFDDQPFPLDHGDLVLFPASFMYPDAVRRVSWMN